MLTAIFSEGMVQYQRNTVFKKANEFIIWHLNKRSEKITAHFHKVFYQTNYITFKNLIYANGKKIIN